MAVKTAGTIHFPALLKVIVVCLIASSFSATAQGAAPDQPLRVGMGLGGISYFSTSPFADTMRSAGDWMEFDTDFGKRVSYRNSDGSRNPQFNENGFPNYLHPGKRLRTLCWPYGLNGNGSRPSGWPLRNKQGVGKWVLTWKGNADIRLGSGTFVAAESTAPAAGNAVDGRRVYLLTASDRGGDLTVESIVTPVTDIKLWLPDPAAPLDRSLENAPSTWHPEFLASLGGMNHLRMMDWGETNASPQRDWSDRRLPSFRNQHGILHPRSPAEGVVNFTNSEGQPVYFSGNRGTGMAFEHMVRLCNDSNTDLWINVPHLATDDFITKMAQLVRYGSDGEMPYTSPQANPVHPPLKESLRVYVEFSNEIWSNGDSFPQGNWAEAQASAGGMTRPVFVARRIAHIWSEFQRVFGSSHRLVNVAGLYTANNNYGRPLLQELRNFGPTLQPPVSVDVISPTTYFGNGIQDWVYEQALASRGTSKSWFLTTGNFVVNEKTGEQRPVSLNATDSYWGSTKFQQQIDSAFAEWKKRMLSGSTASGGGFDSTGALGGFGGSLITESISALGFAPKVISYEGGPSLYTDYLDAGDKRDDGITTFVEAMNRRSDFLEIYRMQLNAAVWKGLDTHTMFVDVSLWGKFGQWGHSEYPGQPLQDAVKRRAVNDSVTDLAGIRKGTETPIGPGGRPVFSSPASDVLPLGLANSSYAQEITVTGGDPDPSSGLRVAVVGSALSKGISIEVIPGSTAKVRVAGTPAEGGWNYLFLRASDKDGDAAWRIFSFYVAGGPGTLVETDLRGAFNGSASLPWTKTHATDSRITYSGLQVGREFQTGNGSATKAPEKRDGVGVRPLSSSDGILFQVDQGGFSEADATLASAITDGEYFKFTITPKAGQSLDLRLAEMSIRWLRNEYHAPRRLAVLTSIGGFAPGREIFSSTAVPKVGEPVESTFRFPETAAYQAVTSPVEVRVYFFGCQYAHKATLLGVKLTRDVTAPYFHQNPVVKPSVRLGNTYRSTLAGSAASTLNGTLSFSKVSGPAWLSVSSNGSLAGTPQSTNAGLNRFTVVVTHPNGASATATLEIDVQKNPQSIGPFTPLSNRPFSSKPIAVVIPTSSSRLPVFLSVKSGPATIKGNLVRPTAAGTIVLAANQPGNASYAAAPEKTISFIIQKIPQSISSIPPIPDLPVGATPHPLSIPKSNSGLPVTLRVKSGPATINGNRLSVTGPGTVVVAASQSGNAIFHPANEVTTSFTVFKRSQQIRPFPPFATQNAGTPLTITPPTASSGLPVGIRVKSGNATLQGNVLNFASPGTVVLSAQQPGNASFSAAPEVLGTITVGKPLAALQVTTPDPRHGTITQGFAGTTMRELDRTYTMSATPASGMRFVEWRRNGVKFATTPALTFAMSANLQWTAVFAPNFTALAGTYAGLIGDGDVGTGGASEQAVFASRNGFVDLTLSTTGAFTGRVFLDGAPATFTGNFTGGSPVSLQVPRSGKPSLALTLSLTPALPGEVTGSAVNGLETLPVRLLRTAYRGQLASHPLSGQIHNLVFTGAPAEGYRFARLATSASGTAKLELFLETGESLVFKGGFSDDGAGRWIFPFHIPTPNGLFQGECVLLKSAPQTVGGSAEWLRTGTGSHLWAMNLDGTRVSASAGKSLLTGDGKSTDFRVLLPDGNGTATVQGQWPATNSPTFTAPGVPSFRFLVDGHGRISGSYNKLEGDSRVGATFQGQVFTRPFTVPGATAKTIGVGHVTTPQGSVPFTITLP